MNFKGTGVAIVTPFNEDKSIDYNGLERLVNYIIDGGVNYIVVQGTTGESATLSKEEKINVLDFIYKITAKKIPLVMGIGGNNTIEVAKDLKVYDETKYDAILSVSPYYNKPNQTGIYNHYAYLAERTEKPIILYNVPGRTGSNISSDTTIKLAKNFKNIVAIKEASGDLVQMSRIVRDAPEGFVLISGDDPLTVPIISIGGIGVISVVANVYPTEFSKMVNYALNSDFSKAREIHNSLLKITDLMFLEGNPAGVKEVLSQLDVCGNEVRLPLAVASSQLQEAIKIEI